MKIPIDLTTDQIVSLARACGFSTNYDRTPDVDEWILWHGHGENYVRHVGTRAAVCAFLAGYVEMREKARALMRDLRERGTDLMERL